MSTPKPQMTLPPPGAVGTRFHGAGNVFQADAGVGAQCEAVECAVMFGDNSDVDL